MISRRTIIAGAPTAALFAACSTGAERGRTQTQLQADVALIAGFAAQLLPMLQAAGLALGADAMARVQLEIGIIRADAAQIAVAATPDAATVQRIASSVQVISDLVLPMLPAGNRVAVIVQAALALLPVILGAVGVAGAPRAISRLAAPGMTPDAARAALRAGTP